MDFYGTRLATCSSDRSVKIFDVRNGQQTLIQDLKGYVLRFYLRFGMKARAKHNESCLLGNQNQTRKQMFKFHHFTLPWSSFIIYNVLTSSPFGSDTKGPCGNWPGHTRCSAVCWRRAGTIAKWSSGKRVVEHGANYTNTPTTTRRVGSFFLCWNISVKTVNKKLEMCLFLLGAKLGFSVMLFLIAVNSVCWAPHEFGLILACGSSDGSISILSSSGDGTWDSKKISNAHTVCFRRERTTVSVVSLKDKFVVSKL